MAVAQSRVDALQSADTVRGGVGACLDALHVSRRALRYSAVVGAGYMGLKIARRLVFSRKKKESKRMTPAPVSPAVESVPSVGGGLLRHLVAQAVTLVVLPWLRDRLLRGSLPSRIDYWRPSRIFFRWIGLEK